MSVSSLVAINVIKVYADHSLVGDRYLFQQIYSIANLASYISANLHNLVGAEVLFGTSVWPTPPFLRLSISIHALGNYATYFPVGDRKLPFQLI